jgi:hypothetical protein
VDPLIKSQLLYQLSYRDKPLDLDGKIKGKQVNKRKILAGLPTKRDFSPKLAARRKFERRLDNNDLGKRVRTGAGRQTRNSTCILYAIKNQSKVADNNAAV